MEYILNRLDIASRAAGNEPLFEAPNGPFTRKLTLENMKWLFDVKVKPLTEPYMKELFYCRSCEANNKLYGFEGVVQHYAAKHTSSLSLGSVVVHWRAEWPEAPPCKCFLLPLPLRLFKFSQWKCWFDNHNFDSVFFERA